MISNKQNLLEHKVQIRQPHSSRPVGDEGTATEAIVMAIIRSTNQVLEIKGLISWPKMNERVKLLAMTVLNDKERKKARKILGRIAMCEEWTKEHTQRVFVAMIRQQVFGGYKKEGPNSIIWLVRRYFMAFGKLVMPAESLLNGIKKKRMLFLKKWDPYRCCDHLCWIAQLNEQAEIHFLKAYCQPGKNTIYKGQELCHNFALVRYLVGEGLIDQGDKKDRRIHKQPRHMHSQALSYADILVAVITALVVTLILLPMNHPLNYSHPRLLAAAVFAFTVALVL